MHLLLKCSEVCWSLLLLLLLLHVLEARWRWGSSVACSHTQVIACQQAQPDLHPFVLYRMTSHSSALQVEETGHWCVEKNRGERERKEALLSCPLS